MELLETGTYSFIFSRSVPGMKGRLFTVSATAMTLNSRRERMR